MDKCIIYFVGGYVRDKLLGIKSKDIDFVFVIDNIDMSIDEGFYIMNNWLINEGFTIFLTTPKMLTTRAKFPNSIQYMNYSGMTADFVLARKEKYTDNSRHPIVKIGTLKDDLERRDFTVNAMAMDLDGNIIDLFNGITDLKNKILRTPINPLITMNDDPLRILRALRFSITKEMTLNDELFQAITDEKIIEKLFTLVSRDRIREELHKMFEYSTSKTIHTLNMVQEKIPFFIERIFTEGLWLKPTTKSIK